MVELASSAAFAEPEGGTTGWSFTDPVNIAEGRQWAVHYWASQDAGAPTPEFRAFRLTNPILTNVTVRTLPGSSPFGEDYLLRAECDFETADDLVMVVIFANASAEQLSRLFESLGKAAKAQAPHEPPAGAPTAPGSK